MEKTVPGAYPGILMEEEVLIQNVSFNKWIKTSVAYAE